MMRRRLIESIAFALTSSSLATVLTLRQALAVAAALLVVLEFWPILDAVIQHRQTPWIFKSTRSNNPEDEAIRDYRRYRDDAREADGIRKRLLGFVRCMSVVAAHSLVGTWLSRVKHDLARLIAAMSFMAAFPTLVVAISYYRSPSDLFEENISDLALANALVAVALFLWFVVAVMAGGNPRSLMLTLASLALGVSLTKLGSTVGLSGQDELQTLVPGMNCYVVGLTIFHLSALGFRPVLFVRLASLVICGGACWIAAVEFYNGWTVDGVSLMYNVGVFAVGLLCVYLATHAGRLAIRRLPPAIAHL